MIIFASAIFDWGQTPLRIITYSEIFKILQMFLAVILINTHDALFIVDGGGNQGREQTIFHYRKEENRHREGKKRYVDFWLDQVFIAC